MASPDTSPGPRSGAEVSFWRDRGAVVPREAPVLPAPQHAASATNLPLFSPSKYKNLATFSSRVAVKYKRRGFISATVVTLVYSIISLTSVNSLGEDGEKAGLRSFYPKTELW